MLMMEWQLNEKIATIFENENWCVCSAYLLISCCILCLYLQPVYEVVQTAHTVSVTDCFIYLFGSVAFAFISCSASSFFSHLGCCLDVTLGLNVRFKSE